MRKRSIIKLAVLFIFLFGIQTASAEQDQPAIAKDSVQVTAFTLSAYQKNYDIWSWVPAIAYRVNGPIASGSQLYVEFNLPGSGPWIKFDCQTREVQKGSWWATECGGREIPEEKSSTYAGPVAFAIRLRNELAGTDATLFTGKMKVAKVHSNEEGPKAVNRFVYYVDHDWNLPIGYVFYERDDRWDPDDPRSWNKPTFSFAFWARTESSGFFEPHLFHGGKEVGKMYYEGAEVSKPSCATTEVQNNTTQSTLRRPVSLSGRVGNAPSPVCGPGTRPDKRTQACSVRPICSAKTPAITKLRYCPTDT